MCQLFLFLILVTNPGATEIPQAVKDQVHQKIAEKETPAIVIGYADSTGQTFFAHGVNASGTLDENTIFEIGSITKTFTSLLLALMSQAEELKLDDPIGSLLPNSVTTPKFNDAQITLRQLATHTSSLPRLPQNLSPKNMDNPYADYTVEQLYDSLGQVKPDRSFGSEYAYSNYGVGLLGHLLALRGGKSYEELVKTRICAPLGMTSTTITLDASMQERLIAGHLANGEPTMNWDLPTLAGAGALRSSAADMLRYVKANAAAAQDALGLAMKRTHQQEHQIGENLAIGLGWHLDREFSPLVWHNGGTGGYRSFCGFNSETGTAVVVLTNSPHNMDGIGMHLLEPKKVLPKVTDTIQLSAEQLAEYEGYYELAPEMFIHVFMEGETLFTQITGQPKFALMAESETRFTVRGLPAALNFERGPDGAVTQLVVHQSGRSQPAPLKVGYEPPPQPVAIELPPEVLAEYVGTYQFGPAHVFTLKIEDGVLMAQLTGQPFFPLFAIQKDKFFYKVVPARLSFQRGEEGAISGLTLHQGGMDRPAPRIK